MIHLLLECVACCIILLGVIERARSIHGPWYEYISDRLILVLIAGGVMGLLLQIVIEGFHPSPFGLLFRMGVAMHYARYLVRGGGATASA